MVGPCLARVRRQVSICTVGQSLSGLCDPMGLIETRSWIRSTTVFGRIDLLNGAFETCNLGLQQDMDVLGLRPSLLL